MKDTKTCTHNFFEDEETFDFDPKTKSVTSCGICGECDARITRTFTLTREEVEIVEE